MLTTHYLLEAFRGEGITHVFLVPGGLIDPFLPALASTPGITPIVACHEGGAACMADGYARASGRFGVCFAIGGPGITNMVTAVAAARSDDCFDVPVPTATSPPTVTRVVNSRRCAGPSTLTIS